MTRDEQLISFMWDCVGGLMVYTIIWLLPVVAEVIR